MDIELAICILVDAGIEWGIVDDFYFLGGNFEVPFTREQIVVIASAIELSM